MPVGTTAFPSALDDASTLIEASNDAATTLTAVLGVSDTSATCADTSEFANSGFIVIDSEVLSYTGKTPTTLTGLIRGLEGTTAASHSVSANVEVLITARHHNVLVDAIIAVENSLRIVKIAGENLGGHRAVYINGGNAFYADNTIPSNSDLVAGITLSSASLGEQVIIQREGEIEEGSWNWTSAQKIYLSTLGQITQTIPTTGAIVELGVAQSATKIILRVQKAVYL